MSELDIFRHGMKREPGIQLYVGTLDPVLELGPGNTPWPKANCSLEYPAWNAETDRIPYGDDSIASIGAFHFLEHIENIVPLLRECQRVLCGGGTMDIVVPYYSSGLQARDLDHKRSFSELTWTTLFDNDYYNKDKGDWKFEVQFNMIMGVEERNLSLCTQLIKRN